MLQDIIGKKIGMTRVFREDGEAIAATAIEAGPCFVTLVKSEDREGYNAIQLGFGQAKPLNAAQKGHLKGLSATLSQSSQRDKGAAENLKYLHEFRVEDIGSVERGGKVDVGFLKPGDMVKISGLSKGKGFAGVVKRHHFAGGPKTHGQTDRHRAPGSIGSTTFPGRVLKGKRMSGHMGDRKATVRNLEVIKADPDRNLLLVKGAVPGVRGGLLIIEKLSSGEKG
jgi:large subunit ribosomal protein L3